MSYRLRDEIRPKASDDAFNRDERKQQPLSTEEPHQFPSDESEGASPTTSIYGFAVGFAAGLLSALGIINFIIPVSIGFISIILSVLLISMFIANVYALKKAKSD